MVAVFRGLVDEIADDVVERIGPGPRRDRQPDRREQCQADRWSLHRLLPSNPGELEAITTATHGRITNSRAARRYEQARKTVSEDQILAEARAQAEADYPRYKRMYEESLAWMDTLDTVMGSFTLGSPPFRRGAATAVISFDLPEGETE